MIIPFDYDLVGDIENDGVSLVTTINGKPAHESGVSLVSGKYGTLSICGDARFTYLLFPQYNDTGQDEDHFQFNMDNGQSYTLVFGTKKNKVVNTLYLWNEESKIWRDVTEQLK